jgi:hypothetical protein
MYEKLLYDEALSRIYDVGLTPQDRTNVTILAAMAALVVCFLVYNIVHRKSDGIVVGVSALAILGLVFVPRVVSCARENRYTQYNILVQKDQEALDKVTELYLAEEAGDAAGKAEALKWFNNQLNKRGAR